MSLNCFTEHDSELSEPIGSGISLDLWDLETFEGTVTRSPSSGAHLACGGKSACHHGVAGLHLHGSTIWNKILVHGMFLAPFWTYAIKTEGSSFFYSWQLKLLLLPKINKKVIHAQRLMTEINDTRKAESKKKKKEKSPRGVCQNTLGTNSMTSVCSSCP